MKTILVPVDFSEYSDYALEVASFIARKQQAEIIAMHMVGISDSFLTMDEKEEVFNASYFRELTKQRFDKLLAKDFLKGLKLTPVLKTNKVLSEINEVVEEFKADLIIMGAHGTTQVKEVFIGSSTERVVRTASVPVLIIKERMTQFNINKAVFVTDFNTETFNAYKRAREFFKIFDVEPRVLFVNIPEKFMSTREMEAQAMEFFSGSNMDAEKIRDTIAFYDDYSTENGIFNYCESNNIDIAAISTHGRKGLRHYFFGSIGEDIANHANIPVITFKI